jgi:hypothetical protein
LLDFTHSEILTGKSACGNGLQSSSNFRLINPSISASALEASAPLA